MLNFKRLEKAVHPDTCNHINSFMHQAVSDGLGEHDTQCPKSFTIARHPVLERLLVEFLPTMEKETEKRLFPTYAYARLYQKGEVLLCHTDRPACEYSATVTLGFDSEPWSIFMGNPGSEDDSGIEGEDGEIFRVKDVDEITMQVGDAVIYKGCDAPHWRDEFSGEWQTQVFLHYVDQDGPNASEKFDGRPALSCDASHDEIYYWVVPNAIAANSCDQMIERFEQTQCEPAEIGGDTTGMVNPAVRDVGRIGLPHDLGIGATMTGMGFNINQRSWNFDITHSNQTDYLRYDENGHYRTHVDTFMKPGVECRKITMLAFLNDDFEGGKLYLDVGGDRIYPPQEKGTVLAFPSFMNHGVEPVSKGIRRSIVTWLVGPWFK